MLMMITALAFGFMGVLFPYETENFERLHIFLFNFCSGCSILLYYSEPYDQLSFRVRLFLLLAVIYSVSAFFEAYVPVLLVSPFMAAIVETIRIRRYSFFPFDFFRKSVPVSAKFHHAALLCLSIAIVIAALVIVNTEFHHFITIPKLELNMFFLGYSFPLSLITMSLVFTIMENSSESEGYLKDASFWIINLGVIVFFGFILAEVFLPQLIITLILFASVILVFYLFVKLGKNLQQKQFLLSGMGFLMVTALSGIIYILLEFARNSNTYELAWLMRIHSFAALYGWNLCGLAIICRYDDFPIRLHSKSLILLHWVTVLILAPLGTYYAAVAVPAMICYTVYLYFVLFARQGGRAEKMVKS
jgi:hypothetical protein